MLAKKSERRNKIKARVRARIFGTPDKPRLSVYRSNKQIYAQLIDDTNSKTIVSASSATKAEAKINKTEHAELVGKAIAEKAVQAGITTVIFDRNGYLYHGRVKKLAEGAREGGLKF